MTNIGTPLEGLPFDPKTLPGPLVQRQVFLRVPAGPAEPAGRALVYAASWWNAEEVPLYYNHCPKLYPKHCFLLVFSLADCYDVSFCAGRLQLHE